MAKKDDQMAASEAAAAPAAVDEGLVRVTKDGVALDVHPSCVKSHQDAGWKVVQA